MKKRLFAFALAGLMVFTGCGGADYNKSASASSAIASYRSEAPMADSGFYEESSYDYATEKAAGTNDYKSAEAAEVKKNDSARKRIITYNLDVETEEFDNLMGNLESRVAFYGGYFESVNTNNLNSYSGSRYGRNANITIRVPAEKADEFVSFIGENSNVTSKSMSSEDITLQYVDLQSQKKSYEAEMESLLELLKKAEKIEDIITIQERITTVRYKLESMESQLRTYDNLVDYTAIYLYINEVKQYTAPEPETYIQRLGRAFSDGWKGFTEWCEDLSLILAESLPGIILLAVIVVVIVIIVRKSRKKKKGQVKQGKPVTPVNSAPVQSVQGNDQEGNNGQQ